MKPFKRVMALERSMPESMDMRILNSIRQPALWVTARTRMDSERGATAVEYGIMVFLIAAVVILAVVFLGNETSGTFSCTAQSVATRSEAC